MGDNRPERDEEYRADRERGRLLRRLAGRPRPGRDLDAGRRARRALRPDPRRPAHRQLPARAHARGADARARVRQVPRPQPRAGGPRRAHGRGRGDGAGAARRHRLDPRRERRRMTVVLYDSAVSGNCYKVRLLFALLGVEYERRAALRRRQVGPRGGARRPQPRPARADRGPRGRPASRRVGRDPLVFRRTGREYVPSDPFDRAKVLQWMFFEQYSHEPYIAVARNWLMHDLDPVSGGSWPRGSGGGYVALDALERGLADGRDFLAGGASRSPTSRSTPTRTSRIRAASISRGYPRIRAWIDCVAHTAGLRPDRRTEQVTDSLLGPTSRLTARFPSSLIKDQRMPAETSAPLEISSVEDGVYRILRQEIGRLELAPGERLRLEEVAAPARRQPDARPPRAA